MHCWYTTDLIIVPTEKQKHEPKAIGELDIAESVTLHHFGMCASKERKISGHWLYNYMYGPCYFTQS